jgi:DNA recombination protein RmuC
MAEVILIITGVLFGGFLVWLVLRNSGKEKMDFLIRQSEAYREQNSLKEREINELNRQNSQKTAELNAMTVRLQEQKAEMQQLREKFNLEFKNLANEIFDEKSKKFAEQNKESIGNLLNPLNEKIKDFQKRVEEVYDKESKLRFSLAEQVKDLVDANKKVSEEANNLARALKSESKTAGNWGEMILESILEKSGLVKGREYFMQESGRTEDGRIVYPDVVVKYPGDRFVVIDSKLSLNAYERYQSSDDKVQQEQAIKEHLRSVKEHIISLSSKNYQGLYELKSLDFTMMFIPIEPAYFLAVNADQELWTYAYERRILLISPTNLIAALKMIESMWRQEFIGQNAIEIAKRGGDMYDKFVAFVEDMDKLGARITDAQKAWDSAVNKLHTGRGNLVKKAQDMKTLGAKAGKSLPEKLTGLLEEE